MPPKPKLLFTDTTAVIVAHMCGQWSFLCDQFKVHIADKVDTESQYYYDKNGNKQYIDLAADITAGRVTLCSPSLQQLATLTGMLQKGYRHSVHDGELHLIAYAMGRSDFDEFAVVTGDTAAVCVAEGLGMRVLSLQEALEAVGRHHVPYPKERPEATRAHVQTLRRRGEQKRTEGSVFDAARREEWENGRDLP